MKDFTIVYKDCNGVRREFYLMAHSISNAVMSANELLPHCVEIIRAYHDASWPND